MAGRVVAASLKPFLVCGKAQPQWFGRVSKPVYLCSLPCWYQGNRKSERPLCMWRRLLLNQMCYSDLRNPTNVIEKNPSALAYLKVNFKTSLDEADKWCAAMPKCPSVKKFRRRRPSGGNAANRDNESHRATVIARMIFTPLRLQFF